MAWDSIAGWKGLTKEGLPEEVIFRRPEGKGVGYELITERCKKEP